ncbi:hypothetical protein LCGC14_2967820, partial [marine sediment metagenome]
MPPFPDSFPPKREAITTFDFTDVASGLGYESFFLCAENPSGGIGYFLNSLGIPGKPTTTQWLSTTTTNFDTSVFNLPRTIRGTAYVVLNTKMSTATNLNTFSVKLIKVAADLSTSNLSSEITSADVDD